MRGHVIRTHPETLPKDFLIKILEDDVAMDEFRRHQALAPDLWRHFFGYLNTLRS
jgi:hypothetical protein